MTRRPGPPPEVRIEAENEWAWCGERRLELTPRTFAVLRHLVEHAGRLVTRESLLRAVWRDAVVSDDALASCIRDLRRALADSSRAPRYVETVHRRGFRFIGPVAGAPARDATAARQDPGASGASPSAGAGARLVGREAELARLHASFHRALAGRRQLVFVSGEPGIGKTTLVEAFLAQIAGDERLRVGRGQCVEQYGAGETYLPMLEALGRLGREAAGATLVRVLRQYAPTWLAQLPALLGDADLEAVQHRAQGATRDRMLREIVEALDAVGRDGPLILVLEDLHWSDSATIDLLAMLARRRDAARLLVLGTYRPADVAATGHPLRSVKQELALHGHCEDLPLEFLTAAAIREYLSRRFGSHRFPPELALLLHRKTDGNPLFLVNTIDDVIARGQVRDAGGHWVLSLPLEDIAARAPDTLWQMVEEQLQRLAPPEQAMLAVASVAGVEFSAAIAAADGIDPRDGERQCEALARRGQFLRAAGAAQWPDGTVAGRYAFIHALYQNAVYTRIPAGIRADVHLRVGERLERGYGPRAGEIAGELAVHFEHGRDHARALRYRREAGEQASRQHGYREVAEHVTRALALLAALPDAPGRSEQELALHTMLGSALAATQGYAAPEVARAYAQARALSERVEDSIQLFPSLLGLGRFHHVRGEVAVARDVGRRLLAMAEATGDPAVGVAAHNALGIMSFYAGDLDAALAHLERGLERYDPIEHAPGRSAAFRVGQDPGVSCLVYAAWTLQLLGFPARAAGRMRQALAAARSLEHPFSLAYACHFAAGFHLLRGECEAAAALEDEAGVCSTEHGFRLFLAAGAIHRGWLLCRQAAAKEGLALVHEGLAGLRAIGTELRRPAFLALLTDASLRAGRLGEGRAALIEALAVGERTGQHYWDAELHRLEGALALEARAGSPESSFLEAIEIARRQGARAFELRAATDLGRRWGSEGRLAEASDAISAILGAFTEGLDTADAVEAQAVLGKLMESGSPGAPRQGPGPRPARRSRGAGGP